MAAAPVPTPTSTEPAATPALAAGTRPRSRPPGPVTSRFTAIAARHAHCQYELVHASADVADSAEWAVDGSPTAAHWIAAVADVEVCTAREWVRIGRRVRDLPLIHDSFRNGQLSYSKVRALTRLATPDNEVELIDIALTRPAGALTGALARWFLDHTDPAEVDAVHRRRRSVSWRPEHDGMIAFQLRLAPAVAASLTTMLQAAVVRTRPEPEPDGTWPSLTQQYADAIEALVADGGAAVITEVVLHVRGDGCSADDGTPISETAIARLIDDALLRALIHDAQSRPINASSRRRHPTRRQKRVVKERDRVCRDCGTTSLLEYDHVPPYEVTGHTITDELELRCAPCHRRRHGDEPD